jgi:hypothetical protein
MAFMYISVESILAGLLSRAGGEGREERDWR